MTTGHGGRRIKQDGTVDDEVLSVVSDDDGGILANGWEADESPVKTKEDLGKTIALDRVNFESERGNYMITVQFKTEDVIYVLPDSESLTQEELEAGPSALDRNRWWPAKIVECCFITQNEEKIGFLKVRWFYTCEEALQRVPQIAKNASLAKRLREYECRPYEYILTDHEDWIPLSSFGAFADKVHHFVALHGLRVSDEDRLIEDPSQRPKPSRPNKIWADGWEKRAYEARAEQQAEEARLNACARAESESSTCHDNNGSINSLSYHCRRPCRNVFPEKCRMPSSCNSSGFSIEAQDCSFHLRGDHQEIEEFSQSPPKLRETVFPNLSLSPLF